MKRTGFATTTSNRLLMHFDDVGHSAKAGATRVYLKDGIVLAMAIEISREDLRSETRRSAPIPSGAKPSPVVVDGLPFLRHAQVSVDAMTDRRTPVEYLRYSMNLDRQVSIDVIARGPEAEVQAFLAGFDLEPIVEKLPHKPAGYAAGQDSLSTAELQQETR